MTKYVVLLNFDSSIFKGLEVPKGSLLEERFGVLYFKKKPVAYIEEIKNIVIKLLER